MAKINSSIVIKGTINGINYYVINGMNVARKAGGGFNRKDIKTKANMENTRNENVEFEDCSKVAACFRRALGPYLKMYEKLPTIGELLSFFSKIKKLDEVSGYGKRSVGIGLQSKEGVAIMESYTYPKGYYLSEVLGNRFVMNWETGHCMCPDFKTTSVSFPSGATHVGLLFGVIAMDFEKYASDNFLAEELFIARTTSSQAIDLATLQVPIKEGRHIGMLGVCFYQEVNGAYYALEAKQGVGVLGIAE